jgi:alkaline phosphatase/alkaline phosphatase D
MAYEQFFLKALPSGVPYLGTDKPLGYPGLASMGALRPDFAVGTGDAVYYDWVSGKAETREEMRQRWREQAILPRFKDFFSSVASYWQKDDHDYRFNDSDPFMPSRPSADDGRAVYLEQVPLITRGSPQSTYRTHRVSRDLQIWMTEGRDFRSPNNMPDSSEKTLWGAQQRAWLQATLRESDAAHLLLISPDPMIGPDFASKSDNHANPNGFRYERDSFFQFVTESKLTDRLTIICGDRHWPYHSVSRDGIHEFSTGTLTDGCEEFPLPKPGDLNSTDPGGEVDQRFLLPRPIASFIHVVSPGDRRPIQLEIWSSQGDLIYSTSRP